MADKFTVTVADVKRVCISTEELSIELNDVCYVLKLKINLISLGKLASQCI
ncbi:hypothetical protein ACO22_07908 [Paracoccidioides brasiliensis]|uniref:Retrovirus-related Pol polyprotein from transposon TNT 1-94-like beta-barrel domain-containing protein n=1 Tax=Paracoccidioides brasiliensis TaxID=121759 RepID=A0A1D2J3B1_PARBR|nr:hypothetical protein ACO22_07908 [Paracoccidioides brasiliensis]